MRASVTQGPLAIAPVEVFGVSHQFALNQNVKLALQAQRQRYTGDYDVGLQLSIPLN